MKRCATSFAHKTGPDRPKAPRPQGPTKLSDPCTNHANSRIKSQRCCPQQPRGSGGYRSKRIAALDQHLALNALDQCEITDGHASLPLLRQCRVDRRVGGVVRITQHRGAILDAKKVTDPTQLTFRVPHQIFVMEFQELIQRQTGFACLPILLFSQPYGSRMPGVSFPTHGNPRVGNISPISDQTNVLGGRPAADQPIDMPMDSCADQALATLAADTIDE